MQLVTACHYQKYKKVSLENVKSFLASDKTARHSNGCYSTKKKRVWLDIFSLFKRGKGMNKDRLVTKEIGEVHQRKLFRY